ncbi:hypothetical protein AC578_7775 [Pseudocercospora eumusae]|uniref:Uncharacterized protein n=1 Tax=Pseudocercospora eumusae TaxID=321146 RepID=A0A139H115_9PEZI|nr:hypothetical protein AC578_7775 [Pseudocercospora eumusae]
MASSAQTQSDGPRNDAELHYTSSHKWLGCRAVDNNTKNLRSFAVVHDTGTINLYLWQKIRVFEFVRYYAKNEEYEAGIQLYSSSKEMLNYIWPWAKELERSEEESEKMTGILQAFAKSTTLGAVVGWVESGTVTRETLKYRDPSDIVLSKDQDSQEHVAEPLQRQPTAPLTRPPEGVRPISHQRPTVQPPNSIPQHSPMGSSRTVGESTPNSGVHEQSSMGPIPDDTCSRPSFPTHHPPVASPPRPGSLPYQPVGIATVMPYPTQQQTPVELMPGDTSSRPSLPPRHSPVASMAMPGSLLFQPVDGTVISYPIQQQTPVEPRRGDSSSHQSSPPQYPLVAPPQATTPHPAQQHTPARSLSPPEAQAPQTPSPYRQRLSARQQAAAADAPRLGNIGLDGMLATPSRSLSPPEAQAPQTPSPYRQRLSARQQAAAADAPRVGNIGLDEMLAQLKLERR